MQIQSRIAIIQKGDLIHRVMLPLFDMLNHSANKPNATWKYSPEKQGVEIIATADVEKGQELFL